jgi:hypothetical protein
MPFLLHSLDFGTFSGAGVFRIGNLNASTLLQFRLVLLTGFAVSKMLVESSLFRADIKSDCKYLEVPPGAVSH